jgi:hypothetical protein
MRAELRAGLVLFVACGGEPTPAGGAAGVTSDEAVLEMESPDTTPQRSDATDVSGSTMGSDSDGPCPVFRGERFNPGVIAETQADLDALEGCARLDASLSVNFAGADLRPLHELQEVAGYLTLSGAIASLEGLERLETVGGWLEIDGVTAPTLAPLGNLTRLGNEAALVSLRPALTLSGCPNLVDLTGLGGVDGVVDLSVEGNEQLVSLDPLDLPEQLGTVLLRESPALSDVSSLAGVRAIEQLELRRTGVGDLSVLADLQSASILSVGSNSELSDVDALAALVDVGLLALDDNASLVRAPSFDALLSASAITISGNAVLTRAPRFPALLRLSEPYGGHIQISNNPQLAELDGFARLEAARYVTISGNATLQHVDLSGLVRAFDVAIFSNPLLTESTVILNSDLELGVLEL